MADDHELIYALELKVIDLEQKVADLETRLSTMQQEQQSVPPDVQARITSGENALRVVREYRLLTQKELGDKCGIRSNHISAIERGQPFGLKTARRLAAALDVPVEVFL